MLPVLGKLLFKVMLWSIALLPKNSNYLCYTFYEM